MALTTNEQNSAFGAMAVQTDASTVADRDIFASGAGTIRAINVENDAAGTVHYLKIYDSKEPTVGTTEPIFILKLRTSSKTTVYCNPGIVCDTGVSVCASDAAGKTIGGDPGATEVPYIIYGA